MTAINAVIIPDAKAWIQSNIRDLSVDGISAVYPTEYRNDGSLVLYDEEEEKTKTFSMDEQIVGLQKLAAEIGGKRLFVGGIENPADLEDACNWDVEVADAFFQLIYHGEVIYG